MSTGPLGSSGLRPLECQVALLFQSCVTVPVSSNFRVSSCDCLAHRFGNAADRPERVPVYPSDMTDAEWAVVRDAMPLPAWLEGRGGQPEGYCHRVMLDAIRYVTDNGIKWRSMPADFPVWDRVYAFFRRWREHGLVKEFHDRLRGRAREAGAGIRSQPRRSSTRSRSRAPPRCPPLHAAMTAARRSTEGADTSSRTARQGCCLRGLRAGRSFSQPLTASAICWAVWAGVRCVVSTTSASACSHVRAASA